MTIAPGKKGQSVFGDDWDVFPVPDDNCQKTLNGEVILRKKAFASSPGGTPLLVDEFTVREPVQIERNFSQKTDGFDDCPTGSGLSAGELAGIGSTLGGVALLGVAAVITVTTYMVVKSRHTHDLGKTISAVGMGTSATSLAMDVEKVVTDQPSGYTLSAVSDSIMTGWTYLTSMVLGKSTDNAPK